MAHLDRPLFHSHSPQRRLFHQVGHPNRAADVPPCLLLSIPSAAGTCSIGSVLAFVLGLVAALGLYALLLAVVPDNQAEADAAAVGVR